MRSQHTMSAKRVLFRHVASLNYAVSIALFALSAISPLTHAEQPRNPEWAVPVEQSANLFSITPTLFRSAQLEEKDLALIKSLGIQTVVSLRNFHSDDALFKDTGVAFQRIGINTWQIGDRHVIAALRAIRAAEKDGPVLLHCMHGADRTGLISAMYRMLYQGWSKEQALAELTQGGYGYHALWKNIPRYLQRVDVEKIRAAVER
jgi:protein tyrosine/serine phosphatase